jgi:hypothetical protein
VDIEMESIIALNNFKSNLKNPIEYGNDGFKFEGFVTYYVNEKVETEILQIALIIGGFEPMIKMDLDAKARILVSKKYHLDFNPKFL